MFLSLQACMVEVIKSFGNNAYKLPHIGKDKLAWTSGLPTTVIDVPNNFEM